MAPLDARLRLLPMLLGTLAGGIAPTAWAQEPPSGGPTAVPPGWRIDHWTSEDGLPGNFIADLTLGGDGYLWLLASQMPVRFDGVRFTAYPPAQSPGSPRGSLRSLARGRGDTIWFVTDAGELAFHARDRFGVLDTLSAGLWDIVADEAGRLVIGGADNTMLKRTGDFRPQGMPGTYRGTLDGTRLFPQLRLGPGGRLWANAAEGIFEVVDTGVVRAGPPLPHVLPVDARTGEPLAPRPSSGGGNAAEGGPGVVELVGAASGEVVARYREAPGRGPRLVDRRGRLWLSRFGTLEVHEPLRPDPAAVIPLGADVRVGRLILDDEGSLWAGTGRAGLIRIVETPFLTVGAGQGLPQQALRVAAHPDGRVLVVDGGKDIYDVTDGRAVLIHARIAPHGPTSLAVDRRGTLWTGGSFVLDGAPLATGALRGITADGDTLTLAFGRSMHDVTVDRLDPGIVWVATVGGVHRVNGHAPGGPRLIRSHDVEGVSPIRLQARPEGGVWAILPDRIVSVEADGARSVEIGAPGARGDFRAMLRDADGGIWIGTYGDGLLHVDAGRVTRVAAENGLAEDVVSSLLLDSRGHLWMGGNRSVHRVALAELRAFVAGAVDRVEGVAFAARDGAHQPETSGYASLAGPDGRLWFPTFGGVAVVDPDRAAALAGEAPDARVEGLVTAEGLLRPTEGMLQLPRRVRDFDVLFTSGSLRDADRLAFEYRLDGIDGAWNRVEGVRTVRYAGVRGGTHRFRIRARSPGGFWGATRVVDVQVPRRFSETPLFALLLLGLAAVAVMLVMHRRTHVAEARALELESQVARRTDEVVEEKARTERALATVTRQREELAALDEAKGRFFANVTHELRTPVSLILGPLEDLRRARLGELPEAARRELDVIRENGQRLLELVDQLLDVARLEAGALPLRREEGDLHDFLRRRLDRFAARARPSGVDLSVDVSAVASTALFDADALEKVIANLLGNALKFTPAGERVAVRAETRTEEGQRVLELEISDSGPGIPAEELPRIFERFQRVDERRGGPGGSGVGLALVRELVELMEGEVRVESRPGEGATFSVSVPVGAARAGSGDPGGVGAPHDPSARPTVLLVEDHPDMRAYLRRHLEPHFEVVEASNGREGLDLARAHTPDVVVSDIMMPEMDGEELTRALRADPATDFVPVVLLTAKATREDRLSGLREGADAYLTKPFSTEELLLTVTNQVASRRRLRERLAQEGRELTALPLPWQGRRDHGTERFLEHLHRTLSERVGDEDLTPESLAQAMHMSRSTLYRRAKDALDASPMDVIWDFRLEQARAWLAETEGSVAEVAYAVGFKSVSHFSKRYRERWGETPSSRRDG